MKYYSGYLLLYIICFRVPYIDFVHMKNDQIRKIKETFFAPGFAYNIALGTWIVWGMFGEHFLLAKLLETLIEPAYYPPVKYMHVSSYVKVKLSKMYQKYFTRKSMTEE